MDINIRLEVTPGTGRRLAYLGVTLGFVGAAAVAYAVPVTFAAGQTLTAAQLNKNFAELQARIDVLNEVVEQKAEKSQVPVITGWTQYTPSLTKPRGGEPISGQTTIGFYRRVGDSAEVRVSSFFNAAPLQTAQWWEWSLPANLRINVMHTGGLTGEISLGGGIAQGGELQHVAVDVYAHGENAVSAVPSATGGFYINERSPFVFGDGATVTLYFTVPIVGWDQESSSKRDE